MNYKINIYFWFSNALLCSFKSHYDKIYHLFTVFWKYVLLPHTQEICGFQHIREEDQNSLLRI